MPEICKGRRDGSIGTYLRRKKWLPEAPIEQSLLSYKPTHYGGFESHAEVNSPMH